MKLPEHICGMGRDGEITWSFGPKPFTSKRTSTVLLLPYLAPTGLHSPLPTMWVSSWGRVVVVVAGVVEASKWSAIGCMFCFLQEEKMPVFQSAHGETLKEPLFNFSFGFKN